MHRNLIVTAAAAALVPLAPVEAQNLGPSAAAEQERPVPPPPEPNEAWWTGPLLANTPNVPPPGHLAIETYVFDVLTDSNSHVGSLTFAVLGITQDFAFGVVPGFSLGGTDGSKLALGDVTLRAQLRLTRPKSIRSVIVALAYDKVLTTGRFQNLRAGEGPGSGGGFSTETPAIFAQRSFVLPNRHILRGRINASLSLPSSTSVKGRSIFGTDEKFNGRASTGTAVTIINSWEYSLSRRVALAVDFLVRRNGKLRIDGSSAGIPLPPTYVAPSYSYAVAPAVEYSFSANVGIIGGIRFARGSHSGSGSVTPVTALNLSF